MNSSILSAAATACCCWTLIKELLCSWYENKTSNPPLATSASRTTVTNKRVYLKNNRLRTIEAPTPEGGTPERSVISALSPPLFWSTSAFIACGCLQRGAVFAAARHFCNTPRIAYSKSPGHSQYLRDTQAGLTGWSFSGLGILRLLGAIGLSFIQE